MCCFCSVGSRCRNITDSTGVIFSRDRRSCSSMYSHSTRCCRRTCCCCCGCRGGCCCYGPQSRQKPPGRFVDVAKLCEQWILVRYVPTVENSCPSESRSENKQLNINKQQNPRHRTVIHRSVRKKRWASPSRVRAGRCKCSGRSIYSPCLKSFAAT